jgi:hypothetical protein
MRFRGSPGWEALFTTLNACYGEGYISYGESEEEHTLTYPVKMERVLEEKRQTGTSA